MRISIGTAFVTAATAFATASVAAQTTARADPSGPGPGGAISAGPAFGMALAVSDTEILVGEPASFKRPGTVYIYRWAHGDWSEAGQLRASDAFPGDGFGATLTLQGSTLVVGAASSHEDRGAAYIFERTADGWSQMARIEPAGLAAGDRFGSAVALHDDALFISAPGQSARAGAVYVFQHTAAGWSESARVTAADVAARRASGGPSIEPGLRTGTLPAWHEHALLGTSLAVADGRAFVGMPGANGSRGAVVVLDRADSTWQAGAVVTSAQSQPDDRFGLTVAVAGADLMVGAPWAAGQSGAVYVFAMNDRGEWVQSTRVAGPDAVANYRFGEALAGDSAQVWIGAPTANGMRGAAYALQRDENQQWSRSIKLMPNLELIHGAQYGAAVAVHDTIVAIGLTGDDHGAGSVVIFERSDDGWQQRSVLKSPPERLASIRGGMIACSADGTAAGFGCQQVDLLAFVGIPDLGGGRGVKLNDIWGWTDQATGREYALVGRIDGTSFVDVSDPVKPELVGTLLKTAESPASTWRDIKVYRDHAFVVADGAGAHGMQVLDLTRLRQYRGTPLALEPDTVYGRVHSAHNIAINEESGFAYVTGASSGGETCGGGLHMIDIREPRQPRFAGCFADPRTGRAATGYTHDAQCVIYRGPDRRYLGREICLGSNETALSVADVTDKANPRALARASYPNVGYSHQGWLSGDQRYFYMNDELDEFDGSTDRTRTLIWDIADLEDPQLIAQHMGVEAASDHNLYVHGTLMYQSNYRSGLRILDVTDPVKPVEVAFFDTYTGPTGAGFEGSWSNYPFFDSGIIIVSSIGEGLFILKKRDTPTMF